MKVCWARFALGAVICVFGTSALLSACGQKGPLFLPKDKNKTAKSSKVTEKPAAKKDDDKDNKSN